MVFRSEKVLETPRNIDNNNFETIFLKNKESIKRLIRNNSYEKNNDLLSESNKNNNREVAFGSLTERNSIFINKSHENILNPGPGTYNLDSYLIKKSFNKKNNSNKPIDIDNNSLKLFLSIQKKFKTDNFSSDSSDTPGPGHYFKDIKYIKKNQKNIFLFFNKRFSSQRVLSIASNNDDNNKNLEIIHNYIESGKENSKYTFRNKNKIDNDEFFSKIKNKEKIVNNKNFLHIKSNDSQFDNNYINSNKSTIPTINNSLIITNFNKNNDEDLNKFFHIDKSKKDIKLSYNKKYKYNFLANNNIYTKNKISRLNNIKDNTPGPGQYSTLNTLNIKPKDIKFQNFGCCTVRNVFSTLKENNNNNNIISISNEIKPKNQLVLKI